MLKMLNGGKIFRSLVRKYKAWLKMQRQGLIAAGPPVGLPYPLPYPIKTEFPEKELTVKGKLELLPPKEPELEGIEIPAFTMRKVSKAGLEEGEEITTYETTYSLIPEKPSRGEPIFAYTQIGWNAQKGCYEYRLSEPTLTPKLSELFVRVKGWLEEKLDVDLTKLKKKEASDYLHNQTSKLLDYFGIKLTESEKQTIFYYIDRDFLGFGVIEPLIRDPEIEDISCDGIGIPIYIFHRNPILSSIPTNIVFETADDLDTYLVRLAQLCGQAISVNDPLLSGTLSDGSRVQGTLATDIARRGSNFTIRKFTKYPFTPTHLIKYGTADIKTLAFLWLAIDYGCSVLVSGGTATGKTVFLNVISLFIKPEVKVVSIEDTAELKLPHPHWVPHVARVPIATEVGRRKGEVDLFDLLKESMRQRPDYIILGEVRGKEAYVLFQQMATGHPSLATIHADSLEKLTDRMITPPISLPPSLLESLDLILFLTKMKYKGKYVRKVESVYEIVGFDLEKKRIKSNLIFEWDPKVDKIITKNKSTILKKIVKKTGLTEKKMIDELQRRMAVLNWLDEKNITDYRDVARVINLYYDFPDQVMDVITGEI